MARIVAQLLRAARVDAIVLDPNDSCDLSAAAVDVAAQLIPQALQRGKQIEVCGAECPAIAMPRRGRTGAALAAPRKHLVFRRYASFGAAISDCQ